MEMEAYIYNDDKGDDITVCEIPDDMKEDAELYHTELVEKICELDDELMMMYLEDEIPTLNICQLRQTSRQSRVLTKMVMK